MPSLCPRCGETAVISDKDGEMEYLVCQECGCVANENSIGGEVRSDGKPAFFGIPSTDLPKHMRQGFREAEGKKEGRDRAKTIAVSFNFSKTMIDAVDSLYLDIYRSQDVLQRNISAKLVISVACVFVVARQNGLPITLKGFSIRSKVAIHELAEAYRLIIKVKGISLPYQSVGSLCASILGQAKMDKKVIDVTQEILSICDRAWLVSGRHRDVLIHGASYLAWVSNDIMKNSRVKFKTFCKKFGFPHNATRSLRLNEIKDTLFELGKNLPWAVEIEDQNFVIENLKEILQYKRSLFHKSLKMLMENSASEASHNDSNISKASEEEGTTWTLDKGEENMSVAQAHVDQFDNVTNPLQDSEQNENIVRRDISRPPNPRKRRSRPQVHCEECDGNAELSDLELDQYIRTAEEIQVIQSLEKKQKVKLMEPVKMMEPVKLMEPVKMMEPGSNNTINLIIKTAGKSKNA